MPMPSCWAAYPVISHSHITAGEVGTGDVRKQCGGGTLPPCMMWLAWHSQVSVWALLPTTVRLHVQAVAASSLSLTLHLLLAAPALPLTSLGKGRLQSFSSEELFSHPRGKASQPQSVPQESVVSGGCVVASASAPVTLHGKESAREILITL